MRVRIDLPGAVLPIASAALLFAAFPPVNFGWAAWVALVPLLLSLREGGFRRGFRRGLWFAFLFFAANLYWLVEFVGSWTGSLALGAIPWLLLSLIEALYIALFAGVVSLACRRSEWGLLVAPPAWAAIEHLRSVWPAGGFAWAQLSYSQWDHPLLIQPAAWGGTHLLAFLIVLVNVGLVYALWSERGRRVSVAVAGVFALSVIASLASFLGPEDERKLTVYAAQPGLDVLRASFADWYPQFLDFKKETLHNAAASGADLVVFPESYQPVPPNGSEAEAAYVITGQRTMDGRVYQTAYGVTPDTAGFTAHEKSRLVAFGEYVPLRGVLPLLDRYDVPAGDVSAAPPGPPLEVAGLRVGVAICFESLFAEVLRDQARQGVDLLAVMTLDDWYVGSAAPAQHAAASVIRAVENRKPLVRCGSKGVTMIVDRHGRIVSRLPIGEQGMLAARVGATPRSVAPGLSHTWFPWVCYLSLAVPFLLRRPPMAIPVEDEPTPQSP